MPFDERSFEGRSIKSVVCFVSEERRFFDDDEGCTLDFERWTRLNKNTQYATGLPFPSSI